MRTLNQIYLLKAIVLSTIVLFFTDGSKIKALAFNENIARPFIFRPVSHQKNERIDYIVSEERANRCTKYHSGGSIKQLARAYQLAYAKYKLTPVTVKYQPYNYGAEVRYSGRLKKSKQRFEIVTSLDVGASKYPSSATGLDYKHINVCGGLIPVDGYIDYYKADEHESKFLQQTIDLIEAFVSKKYPISNR